MRFEYYFFKFAIGILIFSMLAMHNVYARLPALSPQAKAASEEAAAKNAYAEQVAAYQLCLAQDRVAAKYLKSKANAGVVPPSAPNVAYVQNLAAVVTVPLCQEPAPFVSHTETFDRGDADFFSLTNRSSKK